MNLGVIVTDPPRADARDVDVLARYGVATVHEALGRECYLGSGLRPVQDGARIGGTAVTVPCWPGDNLMIHAKITGTNRTIGKRERAAGLAATGTTTGVTFPLSHPVDRKDRRQISRPGGKP